MKRFLPAVLMALVVTATLQNKGIGQTPPGKAPGEEGLEERRAMLTTYCVTCHNARVKTGGLALDGLDGGAGERRANLGEGAPQAARASDAAAGQSPAAAEGCRFVRRLDGEHTGLSATHAKGPKAGYVPIQRLNRTEYAASVKALVGVDVNPKEILPQDIQVEGFDNIAAALSVSPAFLDQYVTAARQVATLAVGSPNPRVSSVKYPIAANQNPDDPPPPGMRGGMKFKHNFPADGEYRITINDLEMGLYTRCPGE